MPAALVALTLLVYLPTLRNGFIWDDDSYVEHNPLLRSLYGLWLIWAHPSLTPQYYPLVHSSFWLEYQLWNLWPLPYHLLNVLLHATSAVLLARLLLKLNVRGAWLAAAVWAVHPLNVESVAWVTERKNVMSAVFYLLAFTTYLRAVAGDDHDRPIDRRAYLTALSWFALSLLSKTVTSTLPAAILVVLWWQRGRLVRRDWVRLIPFFVIGAAMGSVTGYLERTQVGAHGRAWASLTVIDRVLIASRAVWFYAGKFLWPEKLIFIYPRWVIESSSAWAWTPLAAAVLALVALIILWRRWGRGPLALGLLFVGTLAPALGFVNVYPMKFSFVADHFAYLATAVLATAVGWTLGGRGGNSSVWRPVVAALILIALGARSLAREFVFYDRLTLWRQTVADNPNSAMAHTNLGHALVADQQPDAAAREYERSLQLAPDEPDSRLNVAVEAANHGDLPGAIRQFEQIVALDPTYLASYGYLARLNAHLKQFDRAEYWARQGIAAAPHMAISYQVLGNVLDSEGKLRLAMEQFQQAVHTEPMRAGAHTDLAIVEMKLNLIPQATAEFETALTLDPTDAVGWDTLGQLKLTAGKNNEAIDCFQKSLLMDPNNRDAAERLSILMGPGKAPS